MPEQVWDEANMPEAGMWLGKPAGSAVPLVWAHAEYLKLLRSAVDGKVFDRIDPVYERYCQPEGRKTSPQKPGDLLLPPAHPANRGRKHPAGARRQALRIEMDGRRLARPFTAVESCGLGSAGFSADMTAGGWK